MTSRGRHLWLVAVLVLVPAITSSPPALAQGGTSSNADGSDAAGHFRRGVALYKDADYEGALVEFQRANELQPNYRVLYNIGQSLFQLQRYADALSAFESYLAQAGGQIAPARRASVEGDIRTLRARVGRVAVKVNETGAEIRVDDRTVGTSPLQVPLLVSVGHRKLTVAKAGRVPLEKFIDVAAGDQTTITFEFPPEAPPPAPVVAQLPRAAPPTPTQVSSPPPPPPPPPPRPASLAWIPWTATGVLAVGTAVTGALTLTSKASLNSDLATFPGNTNAINDDRSRAKTFAIVNDALFAATAVSFGLALYVSLHHSSDAESARNVTLGVGLGGMQVRGTF